MEEITKSLIDLGLQANLRGFKYLQKAIKIVTIDPKKINKVTKFLYNEVGKEYNVNGSVVERSMRHAMDKAYLKTGFKNLYKLFNLEVLSNDFRPTNCELIATIAEAVRGKANKLGYLPIVG
jgi:hypothetical protein